MSNISKSDIRHFVGHTDDAIRTEVAMFAALINIYKKDEVTWLNVLKDENQTALIEGIAGEYQVDVTKLTKLSDATSAPIYRIKFRDSALVSRKLRLIVCQCSKNRTELNILGLRLRVKKDSANDSYNPDTTAGKEIVAAYEELKQNTY